MKSFKIILTMLASVVAITSCQKDKPFTSNVSNEEEIIETGINENTARNNNNNVGHVYLSNNQVDGNKIMDYTRSANGMLTLTASYYTGGTGTGGGLGNQGGVVLTEDGNTLLAVNAGSNSISSFKVTQSGLFLKSTVSSGGVRPVSITVHNNLVYVLNAGGDGNISGLRLGSGGRLFSIEQSTRPLSSNASGAAQISFVNEGRVLAITEKATNKIITYTLNESGNCSAMQMITSSSPTPFGFAVGNNGNIFVSEAAGGAAAASKLSSYKINNNGAISLVTGSVGANQSAACWVVITKNGRYAYTTNTASNNLSTFDVNNSGNIAVNTAISAVTEMGPIDASLSNNSRYLYILNSGARSIGVFSVSANGSLTNIQNVPGLAMGANGLASR